MVGSVVLVSPLASGAAQAPAGPSSIVSIGDSIASGEGINYGWTFDAKTGKWTGPSNSNPKWEGDYQPCHQSKDAYGFQVAKAYKNARFTELACTGSTFENGIEGQWSSKVPAQFGDWANQSGLNQIYTQANPDLVLLTLGADDVQFKDIVSDCILYSYEHPFSATQCTADTPNGPDNVIKKDFLDYLSTYNSHLTTLLSWIEARAKKADHAVRIVVTTYGDPLPSDAPAGGKNYCPDTWLFYNDQLTYLGSLVHVLDNDIVSTVNQYVTTNHDANVGVADLQNVYDGHQWCAKSNGSYTAPWAYGMSIYAHYWDLHNPNPSAFHPTPEGQSAIAAQVLAAIKKLYAS